MMQKEIPVDYYIVELRDRAYRFLRWGWIESARDTLLMLRRFRILTKNYNCY